MNPLDDAFLNLSGTKPTLEPRGQGAQKSAATPEPASSADASLRRATGLKWPDLVEQLVQLAAGRFHGVGELLLQSSAQGNKRIALISCHPGEGRTTLALALGRWFSARHRGRKVLLLDADLARADLTHRLGLSGGAGIRDYLANPESWPNPTREVAEGLSILGAGSLEDDTKPEAESWDALAGWLRPHFDVILVDTGPALADGFGAGDARRLAEAVLWIRDPQRTSVRELCDAQRQIALASLGVIENLVPQHQAGTPGDDRRHRVDRAGALHLHINRLRGNGVAKDV